MDWRQAIIKSMKAYYNGVEPSELNGLGKKPKYSKKYFDKVGSEYAIEPYSLKKKEEKEKGKYRG